MLMPRQQYARELRIACMRELDSGKSMAEIARQYQLSPKRLETWKTEWRAKGELAFPGKGARPQPHEFSEVWGGKHSALSRTPFQWQTKSVRLQTGMLFGITTEWCSASHQNRVRLRPDSASEPRSLALNNRPRNSQRFFDVPLRGMQHIM